nr:MAG TPA: hypothetical protein [Caudoviricetes sp.]
MIKAKYIYHPLFTYSMLIRKDKYSIEDAFETAITFFQTKHVDFKEVYVQLDLEDNVKLVTGDLSLRYEDSLLFPVFAFKPIYDMLDDNSKPAGSK